MKDYLIYFAQAYPNFRRSEIESLAGLNGIKLDLSHHDESTPFLVVQLENDEQARKIMERSILGRGIYELWGEGKTLEEVHANTKLRYGLEFDRYKQSTFKFDFVGYMGSREKKDKFEVIESFAYLGFEGAIRMKNPDEVFVVLEQYEQPDREKLTTPLHIWFGRQVQLSARTENILDKYDLKKRKYIGTTSFDAELSLISCNIAQVNTGKVVYDPFAGTGSFLVAAANYGGYVVGSDIDHRLLRGKNEKCNIRANMKQYNSTSQFLDVMTMDFTHNALRPDFQIDTIVCDPPYGVREGLKVCGVKDPAKAAHRENVVIDGEKAHLRRDFIHPKKPYELASLLDDLLLFAVQRLPVGGRLCFWMPTANDEFSTDFIPHHDSLDLLYNLDQEFNKWSRRLLVYSKRDQQSSHTSDEQAPAATVSKNVSNFRARYFKGFSPLSK